MGKVTKALGTGFGMALAATAGAYLLYKKNPKVRNKAKVWVDDMKKELKKDFSKLNEINQTTFKKTVEDVGERFGRMGQVNKTELSGLVNDLKDAWAHFSKDLSSLKKG
ncbi:MAG: hypothetical protein IPP35_01855 [Elusimicrobia bacterium]|nr:hypothetical protein [Elusimicrobiota bacterium]